MNRIVHKIKCRQLERYVRKKLKDVIKQTVDHAVRNETAFEMERRLKGNMVMVKKHIVFHASTHFKSLGLHKKEVAAFVDYYFTKHWEDELWDYINRLDDEALLCLINIIELDEVVVYGQRKKNDVKAKITVSPKTHNGKFNLTSVAYLGVNGYTLGYVEISAPIDEVTGSWPYKFTSPVSISGGASASNPLKGAKPDIEVMAATVGKINFHIERKVETLEEIFNASLESTSASALIKFTRLEARDLHTNERAWSTNALGGGVASMGFSHSVSNISFSSQPMNSIDSIARAIKDTTLNGREGLLKRKNISKDSANYIDNNFTIWLIEQQLKNKE